VDAILPQLLERCGTSETGTITGFFTILVEGDDLDEPVSDTVRGILDGHLVLSRQLARRNHYPAIDVLGSVSRLESKVCDPVHREAAGKVRRLMATYQDAEDLINAGIYQQGNNPEIDEAIQARPAINGMLRQAVEDRAPFADTRETLLEIAGIAESEDVNA
jgi:flagellum-specific ATP synthase